MFEVDLKWYPDVLNPMVFKVFILLSFFLAYTLGKLPKPSGINFKTLAQRPAKRKASSAISKGKQQDFLWPFAKLQRRIRQTHTSTVEKNHNPRRKKTTRAQLTRQAIKNLNMTKGGGVKTSRTPSSVNGCIETTGNSI